MKETENKYQRKLVQKLKEMFPGCIITKNDSEHIQGIPDLTILYKTHWAMLETKRSESSPHRPNQDFYISKANEMSFGRFIFPENEKEVLDELQSTFGS